MRRVYQRVLNDLPADQTAQEAGANALVYVTPAVQQYHQSAAKAMAHILLSGLNPILITGYNIANVSGPDTGMYKFSFTNQMSSSTYSVTANAITTTGAAGTQQAYCTIGLLATGSFVVLVRQSTGGLTSTAVGVNVAVFGDL